MNIKNKILLKTYTIIQHSTCYLFYLNPIVLIGILSTTIAYCFENYLSDSWFTMKIPRIIYKYFERKKELLIEVSEL